MNADMVVEMKSLNIPTTCPECDEGLIWVGVELQCPNTSCGEAKRVESFIKALDIENVSYKRLVEWGINTFEDLLNFTADRSAKLQVAFVKDLEAKLFNQPMHKILRAMKFDGFGTSLFDKLYEHCGNSISSMHNLFYDIAEEKIQHDLPSGIGMRTLEKASDDWFANSELLSMITLDPRYKEPAAVIEEEKGEGKLSGTFLFTGSFSTFARKDLEKMVPVNGGKLASSVSKNLNYLVVGDGGGGKQDKAEALRTVKIIDEATFLGML